MHTQTPTVAMIYTVITVVILYRLCKSVTCCTPCHQPMVAQEFCCAPCILHHRAGGGGSILHNNRMSSSRQGHYRDGLHQVLLSAVAGAPCEVSIGMLTGPTYIMFIFCFVFLVFGYQPHTLGRSPLPWHLRTKLATRRTKTKTDRPGQ